MKLRGLFLLAILTISAGLPYIYAYYKMGDATSKEEFFFGVTYGQDTVEGAKLLIDKVKDYTNLFVIDSYSLSNGTKVQELNEICDYAAAANLHFIVYIFSFYNNTGNQEWLNKAKQTWKDMFLGVYLRDEPGGRQIDLAETVRNASSYSEAAGKYVQAISSSFSMQFLNSKNVPVFTSDYALYWYDYLGGFHAVFAEMGWNNSRTQQIALCRGAANLQGKEWGATITWTYREPPYLASGPIILQDMLAAYSAGAKYVVVFNYSNDTENSQTNPYGTLTQEHFAAMERFWSYVHSYPREIYGKVNGQVAFVLPKDYGWGMRSVEDNIWGLWPADEKAPLILENMNKLITKYGLKLDIVYDDVRFNFAEKYSKVYFWNATIE
jgi:hypothetical protein